ncbi:transcriptional activator protein lasR [Pseudomonas aeruginosa BWHPSA015]|nr:transcriptional activator protein lasR [Pseudomonas aeruginosa BWHPSA015]
MALVDGFLELERSSGKLEWSAILQKMASDLGFSKILFGLLPKDSQDYENAFIVGNYPAAWREHYDRAGYARVDPTVSHCTQSVLPIFWEPSIYQTRKQHEFFEEASAAGLVYGLTMPLHGARGELGALSLSVEAENRAEANRFMESVLPTLWMLKDYALQSGAGLAFEHPVSKPVVLTSREKEVLQWCAIGKTRRAGSRHSRNDCRRIGLSRSGSRKFPGFPVGRCGWPLPGRPCFGAVFSRVKPLL